MAESDVKDPLESPSSVSGSKNGLLCKVMLSSLTDMINMENVKWNLHRPSTKPSLGKKK